MTGATVHLVDATLDGGPIVAQEAVPVLADDDQARLHARIRAVEHRLLPRAVALLLAGAIRLDGVPLAEAGRAAKRRLGYLPENNPLYTEMLVAEYLEFIVRLREIPPAERRAAIDRADLELAPLGAFVLPGGTLKAALLHVARTVCRRAERGVVALAADYEVPPTILEYLNRLSDLLFTLARLANQRAGKRETTW